MKLLVNESQKFDIKYHEDYMGALFVNKETIKQVVLLYRPAYCWAIGTNNIMKLSKLL